VTRTEPRCGTARVSPSYESRVPQAALLRMLSRISDLVVRLPAPRRRHSEDLRVFCALAAFVVSSWIGLFIATRANSRKMLRPSFTRDELARPDRRPSQHRSAPFHQFTELASDPRSLLSSDARTSDSTETAGGIVPQSGPKGLCSRPFVW